MFLTEVAAETDFELNCSEFPAEFLGSAAAPSPTTKKIARESRTANLFHACIVAGSCVCLTRTERVTTARRTWASVLRSFISDHSPYAKLYPTIPQIAEREFARMPHFDGLNRLFRKTVQLLLVSRLIAIEDLVKLLGLPLKSARNVKFLWSLCHSPSGSRHDCGD